jgi:hypothetical protein
VCQHARLGVYAPHQRGGKLLACSSSREDSVTAEHGHASIRS